MHTSESIAALSAALAKAQGEMKNAPLNKTNPHFKSRYADLAAIRDATIPALSKNGLAIIQFTTLDDDGRMKLHTRLSHSSGEWVESVYPLPVDKPQVMGSAITYGKRYSWSAMCGISADEDDDGNAAQEAPAPKQQARATAQRGASKSAEERHPAREGHSVADDMVKAINAAESVARINSITGHQKWQDEFPKLPTDQQKRISELVERRMHALAQQPYEHDKKEEAA